MTHCRFVWVLLSKIKLCIMNSNKHPISPMIPLLICLRKMFESIKMTHYHNLFHRRTWIRVESIILESMEDVLGIVVSPSPSKALALMSVVCDV